MGGPQPIRASCPCCGQVELPAKDVELIVCVARPHLSTYAFRCPACHMQVEKMATEEVIGKLFSVGVRANSLEIPSEVLEEHAGPPLTADDLLDLHEALNSGDMWAELT